LKTSALILGLSLTLSACSGTKHLEPAIPDDLVRFAPSKTWPIEEPGFATQDQLHPTLPARPPGQKPPPPPGLQPTPVAFEPGAALQEKGRGKGKGKEARGESPAQVIQEAQTLALVTPSRKGYFGNSVVQHYLYQPGRIWAVYLSTQSPTTIFMPLGERLASAPALDSESYDVTAVELGKGETRKEAMLLRPLKPGLETTMTLLCQSGLAFFIRLQSTEKPGMLAVEFEVPRVQPMRPEMPISETPRTAKGMTLVSLKAPQLNLDRLHTHYEIKVTKGKPAFIPSAAYDDNERLFLRWAQPLTAIAAPAVFATLPDGKQGLLEWSTYTSESPTGGFFYLVNGLWSQVELRGPHGETVLVTRQSSQPPVYREVKTDVR
jgi:type IV secretion system protein VirB9